MGCITCSNHSHLCLKQYMMLGYSIGLIKFVAITAENKR